MLDIILIQLNSYIRRIHADPLRCAVRSKLESSVTAEYEAIAKRALTPPPNTAALMELVKFVRTSSDVTLKSLELRLLDVIEHVAFLSDYWPLTDSEIANNSTAFQWYHQMPQVLENNRIIVENKTHEYQEALKGAFSPDSRLFAQKSSSGRLL